MAPLVKLETISPLAVYMAGEKLDLTSDPDPRRLSQPASTKRFLGIHFACCDVYTRIYVNRDQTAYEGRCPKCLRKLAVKIGPAGTDSRFFTAR